MPVECISWLDPKPGQVFVDGTLGGGGHTRMLAEKVGSEGQIISFDRDVIPIERAEETLKGLPVAVVQSNFTEIPSVLDQMGIQHIDGVLLDLGLSSDQLEDRERGFSFESDGPLDLRFDPTEGEAASEILGYLPEKVLADLIYNNGEERLSRRIARKICERRKTEPIETARELAQLVISCYPRVQGKRKQIHPATRTFQALRIAVNQELSSLERALKILPDVLKPGGRLAIISFHSLEDRPVKEAFRDDPRLNPLTKKPGRPTEEEVIENPRSRSAKLRVAERVEFGQ